MGTVLAIASLLTALAPILTVFLQALRKTPDVTPQINTQNQLDALRSYVAAKDNVAGLTGDRLADELCNGPPGAPPSA